MEVIQFLLLATFVEGFVEYMVKGLVSNDPKPYIKYVALLVGVVMTVAYQLDFLATFVGLETQIPMFGEVVSGLMIGRGANYVNDLIDLVREK